MIRRMGIKQKGLKVCGKRESVKVPCSLAFHLWDKENASYKILHGFPPPHVCRNPCFQTLCTAIQSTWRRLAGVIEAISFVIVFDLV